MPTVTTTRLDNRYHACTIVPGGAPVNNKNLKNQKTKICGVVPPRLGDPLPLRLLTTHAVSGTRGVMGDVVMDQVGQGRWPTMTITATADCYL